MPILEAFALVGPEIVASDVAAEEAARLAAKKPPDNWLYKPLNKKPQGLLLNKPLNKVSLK